MVNIRVPNDDYGLLHKMSSQELRLPDQMIRWLIRQEAEKRGLARSSGSGSGNGKTAANITCEVHEAEQVCSGFAGIVNP